MAFRVARALVPRLTDKKTAVLRDLSVIVIACVALFIFFTTVEASEHLREWLDELEEWEVDEILLVCASAGIMSAWFSWRRNREAAEAAHNARFVNDLLRREVVEHRLTMSEMLRAKETAEEASKAKSEFVANMSHELRTPLNAVIGFAEMMADEQLGPMENATYHDYSRHIRDSGRHLLELINDILDLSKIESGQLVLEEEPVNVVAVATRAAKMVKGSALERSVQLKVERPERTVCMSADLRMVRQVLLNLLTNAVKFTPDGGRVSVSFAETAKGNFEISVTDTGIGMNQWEVDTAFERFGQVRDPMVREFEGTGLGLPLSRALAEIHGGTLTLKSATGKGTTATFTLPANRRLERSSCTASCAGCVA